MTTPSPITPATHPTPTTPRARRILITAGPTHEPIDAVRYIGNRSSGRLGIALAEHAATAGWETTLLLGPTPLLPTHSHLHLFRFRTTAQLQTLLDEHFPATDVLVMAAAVADYRPVTSPNAPEQKLRRTDNRLILELDPTPDLLAACGKRKRPDQLLVGFALEPQDRLLSSAASKLERKNIDLIVANPLETMDAPTIHATVLTRHGTRHHTDGPIPKPDFAPWLLSLITAAAPPPSPR